MEGLGGERLFGMLVSAGPCPWRHNLSPGPRPPGSFRIAHLAVLIGSSLRMPLSTGLALRKGRSLPVFCALLHRVRAQQGGQDTRLRPAPLHLEVGSEGRILPRGPVGGGQRIMYANHVL